MAIISDDILQGLVLLCLQLTSASAPLSLFGDYHDEVIRPKFLHITNGWLTSS